MKTGILILTIGLLVACNHGGKHEIFDANGLTTGELKSCMLFTTYKDGILGGSASKPTTPNYGEDRKIGTEYNEALCWITHDGGRNWKKMKIDEGNVHYLMQNGKNVYAWVWKNSERGDLSALHVSRDKGKTWQKQTEIKGIATRPHVIDSNRMFFWGGIDHYALHETKDGGKTWIVHENHYDYIDEVFYDGLTAYFLTHIFERSAPSLLVKRDLETGKGKLISMPPGRTGRKGFKDIVALNNNEKLELYRIMNDSLLYLTTFNYGRQYLNYLKQQGDKIYACHRIHRGGSLTPEKMILFSEDGGKTWTEKDSGISIYSDCVSAIGNEKNFKIWYLGSVSRIGTYED